MSEKICPKCGISFTCDGDNDCWCESYQIHKRELLIIASEYRDCLCPGCLKEYTEN